MGYTNFGKIIKKLMIDAEDNLGTLSKLLGVSTAFVSAVLVGKKAVPEEWYSILCNHYSLDEKGKEELYEAYCETKKSIKLDLSNEQPEKKRLALQFQRKLPTLNQNELQSIFKILGKDVD